MSDRIRLALLFVVVLACFAARVTGAFAAHARKTHVHHVAHKAVGHAPKVVHKAARRAHATKAVHQVVRAHPTRVVHEAVKHAHPAKAVRKTVQHAQHHVSRATAIAREQEKVVWFARKLTGIRYTYGGTSPSTGFDCSGFTRFVYAHFGISLPHYSAAQFSLGRRVSMAGLRPGDLLFFDGLGHVGLYVGGGRFIHAPHTGTRVQIDPLSDYRAVFDGARRII
ncbi:MAG TPA: C40 family peptidase [Gaiellaceae bacterium]|nr:C40 family peptidase [Gaiellaceae bacterium]